MSGFLPAILIGYAVGSLPIGYLVAQGRGGVDLRRVGSGNVGATNVYRTSGLALAIAVMLADIGKGAAAVLLAGGANPAAAGVAAVVGHIYPVWLRFRGGKGVATASGVFAVLAADPDAARRRHVHARRRAHAIRVGRFNRRHGRPARRRNG